MPSRGCTDSLSLDGTPWPFDGQRNRSRTQGREPEYAHAYVRSAGAARLHQAHAQPAGPAQLPGGAHGARTASRRNVLAALASRGAGCPGRADTDRATGAHRVTEQGAAELAIPLDS